MTPDSMWDKLGKSLPGYSRRDCSGRADCSRPPRPSAAAS